MRRLALLAGSCFGFGAHAQTIVINPRPGPPPVATRAQRVTIDVTIVDSVPVGPAPAT